MTATAAWMNRKRFLGVAAAGYLALAVVLATLFATGTIFAAFPLAGIGGFVVAAERIEGDGLELTPALGDTSEQQLWPQAAVKLNQVRIECLNLSKNLSVGSLTAKVEIIAGSFEQEPKNCETVIGHGVTMHISGLKANQAEFGAMTIDEVYTSDVLKKIGLTANSMTLVNPSLNTHFLHTSSITLPKMKLRIRLFNGGQEVGGNF